MWTPGQPAFKMKLLLILGLTFMKLSNAKSGYDIEDIRLVNGSSPRDGRVEVKFNGEWGTVCDHYFGIGDASVICRMLNFTGAERFYDSAYFGEGQGHIWLDELECNGDETNIGLCPQNSIGINDCSHSEDASVTCDGVYNIEDIRLANGSSPRDGRVEVKFNGEWGTVCDHDFDISDASVICRMLNFTGAERVYDSAYFGEGQGRIWLDDLECNGDEKNVGSCTQNAIGMNDCDHSIDAGVTCEGVYTIEDIRLANGFSPRDGRVEVKFNGEWGTVCDHYFGISDASVICHMLNFTGAERDYDSAYFGEGQGRIWLDDLECNGDEKNVGSCTQNAIGMNDCDHSIDAGVTCEGVYTIEDIRLANGFSPRDGRVEVKFNGEWGTVCDHDFGISDASVICRMLNFTGAERVYDSAYFGEGQGRIWLDDLECNGDEKNIGSCTQNAIGMNKCDHSIDAGVTCEGVYNIEDIRLANGSSPRDGRVEVKFSGEWGTVCDHDFGISDASVICRMLNFTGAERVYDSAYFGEGQGRIWLDDLECNGDEKNIGSCTQNAIGMNKCDHSIDAGVTCEGVYNIEDIRLANGSSPRDGRVEVKFSGEWGTVCDHDFGISDASVICRMLNFTGAERVYDSAYFGEGQGRIWLDDLECNGDEKNVGSCTQNAIGINECDHSIDAGVTCEGVYNIEDIRLANGFSPRDGRVEVKFNGEWGTVCDHNFGISDASVICRMLNYTGAERVYHSAYFGEGQGRIWLDYLECNGDEKNIGSCSQDPIGINDCDHSDDVGVTCEGGYKIEDIRLADSFSPREGRVEVKFNGEWGTVCDDDFGISDGNVICRMLNFTSAERVYYSAHFGEGQGRIWLADLDCDGDETNIGLCSQDPIGVNDCSHNEDVGVTCEKDYSSTTLPMQDTTTPMKEATTPMKEATTPMKEATTPMKETTTPMKEAITPTKEATTPMKETTKPTKEATTTIKEATTPIKQTTTSMKETTTMGWPSCSEEEFSCPEGYCIPYSFICDGISQCEISHADEFDCGIDWPSCSEDEFSCPEGYCISDFLVCDGIPQCENSNADESNCGDEGPICFGDEFRCPEGVCIPNYWICDGITDCEVSRADEAQCDAAVNDISPFYHGQATEAKGGRRVRPPVSDTKIDPGLFQRHEVKAKSLGEHQSPSRRGQVNEARRRKAKDI